MKFGKYISESSLGRIWQHVENYKKTFAVISAFRGENTDEENQNKHIELKKIVRSMGYGFIEMRGGYREEEGFVSEKSLFIPNISRRDAIRIGNEFNQDAVLYKDSKEFVEIDTKKNIGKVDVSFIRSAGRSNINLVKDAIKDFFSSLLKGSHRGKKFVFNLSEIKLQERTYVGHIGRMAGKKSEWIYI